MPRFEPLPARQDRARADSAAAVEIALLWERPGFGSPRRFEPRRFRTYGTQRTFTFVREIEPDLRNALTFAPFLRKLNGCLRLLSVFFDCSHDDSVNWLTRKVCPKADRSKNVRCYVKKCTLKLETPPPAQGYEILGIDEQGFGTK